MKSRHDTEWISINREEIEFGGILLLQGIVQRSTIRANFSRN